MSWTYSGDPQASDLDAVRFLLQDVEEDGALFPDEEIRYAISIVAPIYGDNLMVAAYLSDVLAASWTGEGNISADGVSVSVGEMQAKYRDQAARFRAMHNELQGMGGGPILTSEQPLAWPEFGEHPKSFGRGSMDNPTAGRQDYGNLARWPSVGPPADGGYWTP